MFLTKKAISRRTILRGAGTAVALPLLDAMIPAFAPAATTAPVRRFGVVYHPNGVIYDKWLPTGSGSNFELSPTLKALEPFKDKLIVVTGLSSDPAEPYGDGGGDHSRACGSYLTGVHVKKSDSLLENAVSMDQIAAKAFENETQLSSLQMTSDENSLLGSCDLGYSCAYSSTVSWLTPTLPLMAENNPRVLFERMFGASDSTDARVRAARLKQDRSLLDSVNDRVSQLQRKLGTADNPMLPAASFDRIFLVHMYHEVQSPYAFLWHMRESVKPDGLVIVVDSNRPVKQHGMPPAELRCEFAALGLEPLRFSVLSGGDVYLMSFRLAGPRPAPEKIRPCNT